MVFTGDHVTIITDIDIITVMSLLRNAWYTIYIYIYMCMYVCVHYHYGN